MAKRVKKDRVLRDCKECEFSIGEPNNHMIGCSNKSVNPGGYKMGYWPRECNGFKKKV